MLELFRKWVINTFGFSRAETNGSLLLIFLIILTAVVPRWFFNTNNSREVSETQDEIKLQEWYDQISFSSQNSPDKNLKEANASPDKLQKFQLSPFDPNDISENDLIAMGFPANIANNMVSYRNAGGSYKHKSDLKRIYGLDEDMYHRIKDFISLPESVSTVNDLTVLRKDELPKPEADDDHIININLATTEELMAIRGIGPVLSERIIKYRDLLGGYHSPTQLHEVYGLSEEVIESLKERIQFDSTLTKININSSDPKQLASHPYIEYSLARLIINYHKVHGPYKQKADIKMIKIVSDSLFQKLSPYISVSPLPESE